MRDIRLLIVEDENIVALDLQLRLEQLGYTVVKMCASGEEAVKTAEQLQPDLILMDIHLRGQMDGIEAAGIIREKFNIPVIYLTAYADTSTLNRAQVTEPFGYLIKPFEERELAGNIQIALYKHNLDSLLRENEQALAAALRQQERANAFLSALGQVAGRIQQNPDPGAVLNMLGEELKKLEMTCIVLLLHPQEKELEIYYTSFPKELADQILYLTGDRLIGHRIPRSQWTAPVVFENGQPMFIADPIADAMMAMPRLPRHFLQTIFGSTLEHAFQALAFLPMVSRGRVIGGIAMMGSNLCSDDLGPLQIFANQVTVAFENARLLKETQQLSVTDTLTGVFNRRYLLDLGHREHERWTRYQHAYSLIMVDLDHFKQVNDRFGHDAGDLMLCEVVRAMQSQVRSTDVLVRYGGEEFILLMPETNQSEAVQIANRLLRSIAHSRVTNTNPSIQSRVIDPRLAALQVTASLGVTEVSSNIASLEDLIRRADQALYLAKNEGRNCVRVL